MTDEKQINDENLPQGWEAYAPKVDENINLDEVFVQDLVIEADEYEYITPAFSAGSSPADPENGLAAEQFAPSGVVINATMDAPKPLKERKQRKSFTEMRKKYAKQLIACVLAVFIASGGFATYFYIQGLFEPDVNNSVFYQKDNSIMYILNDKNEPMSFLEILPRYNQGDEIFGFERYLKFNKSRKYVLFTDVFAKPAQAKDEPEHSVQYANLYYKDLTSDDPAVILDSEMSSSISYYITDDGKNAVYIDVNNNLCIHNLKEKKIIEKNISYIILFESERNLIVYCKNDSYYMKHLNNNDNSYKICTNGNIINFSKNYKTVYYREENSYYKKEIGKEPIKMPSDILTLHVVYDDGAYYFTKEGDFKINLSDYIIDDMLDFDKDMETPILHDYMLGQRDEHPFEAIYDYDAFNEAKSKYLQKEKRESIRMALLENKPDITARDLYYFDGKNENVVCKNVALQDLYIYDKPMVIYKIFEQKELRKFKLSNEDDAGFLDNYLSNGRYEHIMNNMADNLFIAFKEKENVIPDYKYGYYFNFNNSGTKLYFIDEITREDNLSRKLIEVDMNNENQYKSVVIDNNVDDIYKLNNSDSIYYLKSKNDENYRTMYYIDKTPIAAGEYILNTSYYLDNSRLAFITSPYIPGDIKGDDTGTLYIAKGTDTVKIANNVTLNAGYYAANDKYIAYVTDYRGDSGDLYLYNGKTHAKIDTGVNKIYSISDVNSYFN